ncbi:integron integrase [Thioalkalivibrio nitratireducens DSM 14787]|uniref:Integron integrase n=1 Tax=Thioalkalivibrio nitratireducens (strain DSM 14787 / UNIQEM 213 / ALEN2) TaxID=1255043 RepID=L0DY49_THIND|nr:integron integrase [Thioalkalivibrio nitratireducens DSM 14787]
MATGSRGDAERRFWERYRNLLLKQGVKPTAVRWYVLRAEQFIQSFSGRRLAELSREDVDDYLRRAGANTALQPWQFRHIVSGIRGRCPSMYRCLPAIAARRSVSWLPRNAHEAF